MIVGRVERYVIAHGDEGVVIRMRQGRRAVGVALLAGVVLLVSWWFGPFGPHPAINWGQGDLFYWLWTGFWLLAVLLGLVGGFYQEDWTIGTREIVFARTIGFTRTLRRVQKTRSLGIRIEAIPRTHVGPIFPYRLHFLDPERRDSGLMLELQFDQSVDRFLEVLCSVLTVDVEDPRKT